MSDVDGFYTSGGYLDKHPTWHEEDGPWKAGHVLSLLSKNGITPRSVCEVGTGSGEVLRIVADRLPEATCVGYDISPQAIAIARKKERPGLSYRLGSPFEDGGRHDVVMAMDVFEHVEDYFGFLRNTRALGEYQVYNIPLDFNLRNLLQRRLLIDTRMTVGHLHYFTKDTACMTLQDTGHEIIDLVWHSPMQSRRGWKGWARKAVYALNPELALRLLGAFSLTVLCRPASARTPD